MPTNSKIMKNMKKILKLSLLSIAGALLLNACGNEDFIGEIPKGAMVYMSQEAEDDGFIDILDLSAVTLNFTLSTTDARGQNLEFAPIASIDVTVTYTNAAEGTTHKAILENLTAWPKTYSLSTADIVNIFPENVVDMTTLNAGDNFQISADFHMQDGTFLSGWSPALLDKSPASVYSVFINYPVACASALGGTYDYSTEVTAVGAGGDIGGCANPVTGSGTLTDTGGSVYNVSDASFGQYDCAWDDTPAAGVTLIDACNTISTGGADQYGLVYTFNIVSNDGTNLTINWSNDYGDAGTTVLTRTDGKTWPLGLTN